MRFVGGREADTDTHDALRHRGPRRGAGLRVGAAVLVVGVGLSAVGMFVAARMSTLAVQRRVMAGQEAVASSAAGEIGANLTNWTRWVAASADQASIRADLSGATSTGQLGLPGAAPACRWDARTLGGRIAAEQDTATTPGCPVPSLLPPPSAVTEGTETLQVPTVIGGRGIIAIDDPVVGTGGEIVGTLEAVFPTTALLAHFTFGDTGSLAVVLRDGLIVAGSQASTIGMELASPAGLRLASTGALAAATTWAPRSKTDVIFAYAPSVSNTIGVIASIHNSEAMTDATALRHGMWAAWSGLALASLALAIVTAGMFTIRDRRLAASERATAAAEDTFRLSFEASPIGMAMIDNEGRYTRVNPSFAAMLGHDQNALIGRTFVEVTHPDDQRHAQNLLDGIRNGTVSNYQIDKRYVHADGDTVWVQVSAIAFTGAAGPGDRILAYIVDIGDRVHRTSELEAMATLDPITALPNRAAIELLLDTAVRTESHLGVLFVDLDRFKDINDIHGHRTGDEVLKRIGQRLAHAIRPSDIVGRLGGDEFIVICPSATTFDLHAIASRAESALAAPMTIGNILVTPSASVGIAEFHHGETASSLLDRADKAMYHAKQHHRRPLAAAGPPAKV